MIYQVYGYNEEPTLFDEATTPGAKEKAEWLLVQRRKLVLEKEAVRFSICATFVEGNNTIWREIQDTDPEDTVCQVFDTFTGSYTQVNTKTEAYNLNQAKKDAFLSSVRLDRVYELDHAPVVVQPTIIGVDPLPN